jgi:uncharacterized membrane protein YczE
VLLGAGIALMVLARLGLGPWDVFHQGIAKHTGIGIGTVGILVGLAILAMWLPLRQRLGPGTVVNVILVGGTVDVVLAVADAPANPVARAACLAAGIVAFAAGTGLYVGAGLGPGPRDGLMTSLAARTRRSIRGVRTAIELTALGAGWLLGGRVGVGTVLFAVTIGPLVQLFLDYLTLPIPSLSTPAE